MTCFKSSSMPLKKLHEGHASLNESMHTREDTREEKDSGSLSLAEANQSVSEPTMRSFHKMQ